jgi:alpha-tubulin suppressor-like RCC1 family protein
MAHLLPTLLPMPPNWGECKSLSAGAQHSALLTTRGELYTWGRNLCGQLGEARYRRDSCVLFTELLFLESGIRNKYLSKFTVLNKLNNVQVCMNPWSTGSYRKSLGGLIILSIIYYLNQNN